MGEAPTRNNRANRIEDYRSRIPLGEMIVFPPAMTQAQLQEIPKAVIKKEHTDSLIQCGICFQEFQLNENDVRKLPCNHMYHSKCIFPWLPTNPSCPTCRASLPNQNDDDFEDVIREHFDRLTSDLMRYLAERGIEHGRLSVEESGSARTLRSSANVRRFERFETPDDDRAPRRAAALRADRAIRQIYRPLRTASAPTRETRNVQHRSPPTMNSMQRNEEDINGKCVVVTGGSSGIGKSCAKEFARRGAVVVIGDKNVEGGKITVDEIRRETGNMNVTILKLDLSDMDSVEEFGKRVSADHPKIKILLNNAGIGASSVENIKTKDGFNIHIAVNFMGHFLLTNILMDNLKAETDSRIVSMSSTCLLMSQFSIDDINMDRMKFGLANARPYNNTKFMLALLTNELGKRNGINAYALCPGIVDTQIFDDVPIFVKLVARLSMLYFSSSPDEAAYNFVMHSALEKSINIESGKMYRFRRQFHNANKKLESCSGRQLFDASAKLVKLQERLARMKIIVPE